MNRLATLVPLVALTLTAPGSAGEILVDDFDDGDLVARSGLSWIVIADDLMGGPSQARVEWSSEPEGPGGALSIDGTLGTPDEAAPFPFFGAWTAIAPEAAPANLAEYSGLKVRARALQGGFLVGVRRAGRNVSFMAPLSVGAEWDEVVIPFDALRPIGPPGADPEWSAEDLSWIGFSSAGAEPGAYALQVDEIAFVGGPDREAAPAEPGFAGFRTATTTVEDAGSLTRLAWQPLAEDAPGDGTFSTLPDAQALYWALDENERLWFRVDLADAPPERWLGVNVALDLDEDPANGMAWWGANADFHFDRLISAYLNRTSGSWQGALGVSDAEAVGLGNMASVTSDVRVAVDRGGSALMIGVPKAVLPDGRPTRVIATVGSSMVNNDDLPDQGAARLIPRADG